MFFQRKQTNGQHEYVKMLKTSLMVGEKQKKKKILATLTCHDYQYGYYPKGKRQQVLARLQSKGNPWALWMGVKMVQPYGKKKMEVPQKLKMQLSTDPAMPVLGVYLKEIKSLFQRRICTFIFVAALFTVAKEQKQPKCQSTDG